VAKLANIFDMRSHFFFFFGSEKKVATIVHLWPEQNVRKLDQKVDETKLKLHYSNLQKKMADAFGIEELHIHFGFHSSKGSKHILLIFSYLWRNICIVYIVESLYQLQFSNTLRANKSLTHIQIKGSVSMTDVK
jgi:hypothetical protein